MLSSQARQAAPFLLLSLLALAGCHQAPAPDVVATVNGHPITRAELDRAYTDRLGDQPADKLTPEQADATRLGLLPDLILAEIIQQRAAKMNLTATNEEVDEKFTEMKAPYTEEQFHEHLVASHRTVDDVKRDLRRSLTINKLLNKEINSKITVSDADISDYFNAHKAEFNNIDTQYHLAQIVVSNTPAAQAGNLQGSKATSDAEAKRKIQALKNRLDSGEDFGSLAMNFSENPATSPSGGDMGLIPEKEIAQQNPAVFAALSRLKAGQVTDIIPDSPDPKRVAGYAIFELISKDPAGQHDVSEPQIQQKIRQGIRDGRSQLLKGAFFEMLRDQAKVENFFAEQIFKSDAH